MVKNKKQALINPERLTNSLERLGNSLESVGNFLKNFDNLGAFALGAYAVDGNQVMRVIAGLKTIISLNLAKSPNLPASALGVGALSLTFSKATIKASRGDKQDYELMEHYLYGPN